MVIVTHPLFSQLFVQLFASFLLELDESQLITYVLDP